MISSETITTPTVGMAVTWIDPQSDPINARFIQNQIIAKHGVDGLQIYSVKDLGEKFAHLGKGRWIVVVERDGKPLMSSWDKAWGPYPGYVPQIEEYSWHYLQPVP